MQGVRIVDGSRLVSNGLPKKETRLLQAGSGATLPDDVPEAIDYLTLSSFTS